MTPVKMPLPPMTAKKKDKPTEKTADKSVTPVCCVPAEKVHCSQPEILQQSEAVRVPCSSGKCDRSGLMHLDCFVKWEQLVVALLSKSGRGRAWSDRQCSSNVWADKGYDLVYKFCACDCGHGHLRKDLDWIAAPRPKDLPTSHKKSKKKIGLKPTLFFDGNSNVRDSYFSENGEEDLENIKRNQKEKQIKLNLAANRDNPYTKLDLHFLQSEEAEKKLGQFLREWETRLGVTERQWLEIVTGRGSRSESGRSVLRPVVERWLQNKGFSYFEVNPGCLRVEARGRRS